MRLINIVDSVSELNYGVWNAAIINARQLQQYGISSELWYPGDQYKSGLNDTVTFINIVDRSENTLTNLILERALDPAQDIIVTSGIWQFQTKWGAYLKNKGYRWILVPQGMLEPWPLRHKWLKKLLYFNLVEKHLIAKADLIRAVSMPERTNLQKKFPGKKVVFVPNGVKINPSANNLGKGQPITRYLFLSRLHSKKNVTGLVQAWNDSSLVNNMEYELIIAGPDQGELQKIQVLMTNSKNIRYVGTVSGAAKHEIFTSSRFFILPSFSEGLPSSLLEAMSYGLIPIITDGCNLPDVFENELGFRTTTKVDEIVLSLQESSVLDDATRQIKSDGCRRLISERYSLEAMTNSQVEFLQNELSYPGIHS